MKHSKKLLAVVLITTMLLTGCTASWISTALADLPVLINLAETIASLVAVVKTDTPPSATEVAAIQKVGSVATQGLTVIQSLYNQYKANDGATTLQDIQAAIAALQTNLQQALAACQVKDPALLARVTAAVNLIQSTVAIFASLIPQASSTKAELKAKAKVISVPTPKQLRQMIVEQVGVAVP